MNRVFVAHVRHGQLFEGDGARFIGGAGFLGHGDDLLRERTEGFGFGQGCFDPAVGEKCRREIRNQSFAMFLSRDECVLMFAVTHKF